MRTLLRSAVLWLLLALPVYAVLPDEVLPDPVLEARAREISKGLRCLVCRNESIDESNADLARDLRLLVRERLTKGDTNEEAVAYIVNRYGEYVLLYPRPNGSTLILWAAGPVIFGTALLVAFVYLRRRRSIAGDDTLSQAETERLQKILQE